ncbi:sensor histidine kinase [Catenulispora sp. NL8]|uniref:histidine kinase n=1 Tax=Catenulispora pinistramenti TaxID=2705254 RepID=A0ABS5L675_9ACTN|nr:sensor histidine kinase [Catenulispora pinistramenti]MBS2553649.1 sensor histidine kinase [Catenulispora pinistramenti]
MTTPSPPAVPGRTWPGVGDVGRVGRRAVVESLYLLTAPVAALLGLLMAVAGLCVGSLGLVVPGARSTRLTSVASVLVRWPAELEQWRIGKVRGGAVSGTWAGGVRAGGLRGDTWQPRPSSPGSGLVHAVLVVPVALTTSVVTGMWWFVALGASTSIPRGGYADGGRLPPITLSAGGSTHSHIDVSLGLTSPAQRLTVGTLLGLLLLVTLPLMTRACVAVHVGVWRYATRARRVAAVPVQTSALHRLERDIHDGPQQRLVRLALELGRAQHHFDSRPETVREALADAIVQAQEALEELRTLSRGIAPPILVDRGLPAAITALAARSIIPVDLDLGPEPDVAALSWRLDPAVEIAAYFAIAEALTNAAKHSRARRCEIGLRHDRDRHNSETVRVWVTDDGIGGAASAKGHGLRGLDERVRAVGGRLLVHSPEGGPTTITAELPAELPL